VVQKSRGACIAQSVLQSVSASFFEACADGGSVENLPDVPQFAVDTQVHHAGPAFLLPHLMASLQDLDGIVAQRDRPVVVVLWCSVLEQLVR
jgi:hypothetical protein